MKTPVEGCRAFRVATHGLWALSILPCVVLAQQATHMAGTQPPASALSGPASAPAAVAAGGLAATAAPEGVLLTWTAPPVKMPRHFEVERSTDGVKFRAVGVVTAAQGSAYRFIDTSQGEGTVYYRLRQPVAGGSGTSAVLTYTAADKAAWQPSPNPATDWLGCGTASGEYRIQDAAGRTVLTGRLVVGQRIDVRRLRNGNHTLEMRTGGRRVTRTFLKYAPAEPR